MSVISCITCINFDRKNRRIVFPVHGHGEASHWGRRVWRLCKIHWNSSVYVFGKGGLALSVEVCPRRKYEISRDANPFPTGGRFQRHTVSWPSAVESSRECQISKRSLQISVQINYYPHGRRASSSSSLSLLHASVLGSFSCSNPSLPRFHLPLPVLSTFYV